MNMQEILTQSLLKDKGERMNGSYCIDSFLYFIATSPQRPVPDAFYLTGLSSAASDVWLRLE